MPAKIEPTQALPNQAPTAISLEGRKQFGSIYAGILFVLLLPYILGRLTSDFTFAANVTAFFAFFGWMTIGRSASAASPSRPVYKPPPPARTPLSPLVASYAAFCPACGQQVHARNGLCLYCGGGVHAL